MFFYFRTIGKNSNLPPTTQHRHVSLANIATAFLTERKSSSSRRQSSNRRKKRLTIQEKKSSNLRRQTNTNDAILGQRISLENMDGGIAAIFMSNLSSTNPNNKHRTMVRKKENKRLALRLLSHE